MNSNAAWEVDSEAKRVLAAVGIPEAMLGTLVAELSGGQVGALCAGCWCSSRPWVLRPWVRTWVRTWVRAWARPWVQVRPWAQVIALGGSGCPHMSQMMNRRAGGSGKGEQQPAA
eukprot:127735-Chlamydomonas_euryale.AAC.1